MTQNGSQQLDNDDDNEIDLISNESLAFPEFSKCSTSHNIPQTSSSVKYENICDYYYLNGGNIFLYHSVFSPSRHKTLYDTRERKR